MVLVKTGKAWAGCEGSNPIICENGVTYYANPPISVSGPLYKRYFNVFSSEWVKVGPFCSVTWASPISYSYGSLRTDSSGRCGGWWSTGLEHVSMTSQTPGQLPIDASFWRGAVDRLQ